jgi:hypothetical protein
MKKKFVKKAVPPKKAGKAPTPLSKTEFAKTMETARIVRLVNGAKAFLADSLVDRGVPSLSKKAVAYIKVALQAVEAAVEELPTQAHHE